MTDFDWTHYLYTACALAEMKHAPAPNTESKLRAAISRAYYAALHKARIYLRDKDAWKHIPDDRTLHNFVQRKFEESTEPEYQEVAANLRRLSVLRGLADYKDTFTSIAKNTFVAIELSKKTIDLLDTMSKSRP